MPKWKGVGKPNIGPWVTLEKSAMPRNTAITVPITIASRIDSREMVALPILLSSNTSTRVNAARPMFGMLPKSAARLLPPMAQRAATGIRVRPMVVITIPVTSGGKNLVIRENTGVISKPIKDAAITAPSIAGIPPAPSLPTIATMVATPAKDTPCTSGNWQPKNGNPRVCNSVAKPPANSEAAISRPISAGDNPAAWPTINGTATMPPYMVSTCCRP